MAKLWSAPGMRERAPVWELVVQAGRDPVTGKHRQVSRTFRGNLRDAKKAQAALIVEVSKGRHSGSRATVDELFADWIVEFERKGRSPNTIDGYEKVYQRNVQPTLGTKQVTKVTMKMLTDLYGAHQRRGPSARSAGPDPCLPLLDVHAGLPGGLARLEPGAGGLSRHRSPTSSPSCLRRRGWRRAAKEARRQGRQVNDKRVRRLWRDEGLKVPYKRRKKRLSGVGTHVGAMCPIRPNVLWALDFQFDTLADGRAIKMLNVIDEFTREALAIEVDRSIDADHVVAVLDRLVTARGSAPVYVRFDNGPEFVAHAVADWCRFTGTDSVFIDPGSPWQNAWIESFNGRFRDELLNGWQFDSLLEARVIIEDWRIDYNWKRPHTAHGDLTPSEFADQWTTNNQPQAA